MTLPERHLLVCTNLRGVDAGKPSCAARGSETLLSGLKQAVKAAGLGDTVWVTKSGCLKHCSQGAMVLTWPEKILLAGVTLADIPDLVSQCAAGGKPVERLLAKDQPWE
jgi:(2Fe-2S) ferredoxin